MPDLISRSGAGYLFSGLQCLRDPRLRPYLLLPLGLNLLLFVVVSSLLLSSFAPLMASLMASLPAWLGWIDWLLWPLFALTILLAYGYLFNSLAAILGAPFYGLLAQQVQRQAGGPPLPDETFSQTLRRTLAREWEKLRYLLPRSAAIGG